MAKILLVDDYEPNLTILRIALRQLGFSTESASDAEEALDWCLTTLFDLVILDVQLPGKGGIELAQDLRSLSTAQNIPIVAISGDIGAAIQSAEKSDVFINRYIEKPINKARLIAILSELLHQEDFPAKKG